MRLGHISLILFQAFWLNIVVPGHTRGALVMPGSRAAERHSCCSAPTARDQDGKPTADDRARCAVCYFAARMTLPPVIDLRPPELELLAKLPLTTAARAATVELILSYHGRAPPAGASII